MPKSPEEYAHLEWLGYVQPVGLVVSIPAMLEAQCYVNKNIVGEHARFLSCLPRQTDTSPKRQREDCELIPEIRDLPEFTQKVLGWEAEDLKEVPQRVELTGDLASLEVVLPQYHETLRPTHAVPVFKPAEGQNPWMMLVQELATGTDLDDPGEADSSRHWNAAPQAKFERLLRETGVPIGLLFNGRQLRLVYSPRGETSGHATFNVDEMIQVAGRPMFAALHMLLCADRMFSLGDNQRLPAILENSRKYQNTVSTKLAEQVLAALYELMRGFQAANDDRKGELLRDLLAGDPNQVYAGLLRVLMRLVFVMYAEDRDLLSSNPVYSNHYSVTGLFNRLREDAGQHTDTMNQRFGAWSQLIALFRLIYEGGQHGEFTLPGRKGYLFDPDLYPFLEGRDQKADPVEWERIPRVSDGVVFNVLRNLLILDGERLSYRTLDVEQIGSVYETVMGFNLEVAAGKSIAIKPVKSHGAPATINLDAFLETKGTDRVKWLKDNADQSLGTVAAKQLKDATTLDELLEALNKKIAKRVTPRVVPAGAIVLQPSDERRRSGSHYTPRSLTEPIVRTTLEPILAQLCDTESDPPTVWKPTAKDNKRFTAGEIAERIRLSEIKVKHAQAARDVGTPHPSQILDLKICDPAMGSGAFLVEACRQLGDELIKAWYAHYKNDSPLAPSSGRGAGGEGFPDIPADEDEVLYARRLIAQRCLYGVDKNAMAVDLAKLSLWLVTLAKDHAFTFLDHALRHGDSLVGLTREQIIGFHWEVKKQKKFGEDLIQRRLDRATEARAKILNAREDVPYRDQQQRMAVADEQLDLIRVLGNACASAFFAGKKTKDREDEVERVYGLASNYLQTLATSNQPLATGGIDFASRQALQAAADRLLEPPHSIPAFHWEIELPEVFARENGGFDAFVGNPPFAGKNTLIAGSHREFPDWLKQIHEGSHGNADLVSHFFRRCFDKLATRGTFGLIATNTIGQGDTRNSGLTWICNHRGLIYAARRRVRWPGVAAVIVSVVHVSRGIEHAKFDLDGTFVPTITAYLFHAGSHDDPAKLQANVGKSFQGHILVGMGFTFDDSNSDAASPLVEMERIIAEHPSEAERIQPYLGGEEVNNSPTHLHHRFAINFEDRSLEEVERDFPNLLSIVRERVKPQRDALPPKNSVNRQFRDNWWQFGAWRRELTNATHSLDRMLVIARVAPWCAFTFLPSDVVCSDMLVVFTFQSWQGFAVLESYPHEIWARFFSSSFKDDLRYSPTDCFVTFPFPLDFESSDCLAEKGKQFFQYRSKLMQRSELGLTKTYNRFHDPHEQSEGILELRRLHGLMDGAVLRAYGWDDLAESARCEFLLDYEEEEDDADAGPPAAGARKKSKKKKPWRLRWPDEFRDEVLARLLELNEQRYKQELLAGAASSKRKPAEKGATKKQPRKQPDPNQAKLKLND